MVLKGGKINRILILIVSFVFLSGLSTGVNALTSVSTCGLLDIPEETYVLSSDINANNGNCFTVLADGITIDGNGFVIKDVGGATFGVSSSGYSQVTVKDMGIEDFSVGVKLVTGDDLKAIDNTFVNNGIGINFVASNNSDITGNDVSGSNEGIRTDNVKNSVVNDNNVLNNNDGITMASSSDNNQVTSNVVDSGSTFGFLISGDGNTLVDNTISNNLYGIYLLSSKDTLIYNNNFIGNSVAQAAGGSTGNIYNLAAPIGGNYWDNFDKPGEGCNDGNSDGFCDAPYVFDNQDNLPWTSQGAWRPPVCTAPPSNMVSWWDADSVSGSTAFDIQDSNDGTMANGATTVPGKVGQAFSFDGINDYTSVNSIMDTAKDYTIDFWMKPRQFREGNPIPIIIRSGIWAVRNEFGFQLHMAGSQTWGVAKDRVQLQVYFPTTMGTSQWINLLGPAIIEFEWVHVAFTYDASSRQIDLYVNGVLVDSKDVTQDLASKGRIPSSAITEDLLVFGADYWNNNGQFAPGGQAFTGELDEIEVFDRALSSSEILDIYNADTAGKCKQEGPVCGNGVVEGTETCDDGNVINGDGCSDSCTIELSCVTPPSNMISWWDGDGNANDIQDGNDGTLQNGATFTGGKVGQAFSFDGIDDEVAVLDNANLNFGTSDFTIDAWVKSTALNGVIVQKRNPTTGSLYRLEMFQTGSTTSGFQCIITGASAPFALGPINDDAFHHIACVRSGNILKVYVDGVLEGAQTMASGLDIDTSGGQLFIGSADIGLFWNGIIDEVEIFNRALADSEIQDIYDADSLGKCKPETVDNDNDGFGDDVDCNDNDDTIFPGAPDAVCDGVDNNCNGQLDEEYASLSTSCGVGVCAAAGQTSCNNGVVEDSCQPGTPAPDDSSCDALDNDCDGQTDEDYVVLSTVCGIGACGSTGQTSCSNGNVLDSCAPGMPSTEVCDSLDNDCDALTDEDIPDIVTGTDTGVCQVNIQSCLGGDFVVVQPGINPTTEVCDALDNNCNGAMDDLDDDSDGINDCSLDLCPNTVLPEQNAPSKELLVNHFADVDGDSIFETTSKKKGVIDSKYSFEDTLGCSCEQILDIKPGKDNGEIKYGCTKGTMDNFVDGKGWAKR